MTENEKRLRDLFRDVRRLGAPVPSFEVGALLSAVIAERTAAARAEALEEARETFPAGGVFSGEAVRGILTELGAPPASVPAPRDEDALLAVIDAEVREYRGSTEPIRVAIHAAIQSAVRSAMLEAAADHLARNRGLDVGGTATFLQNRVNGTAPASIPVEKVREVIGPRLEHARSEGYGWVAKELQAVAEALGVTCDCTRPLGHDNAPDCGVPIDGGQGAEGHAGRELIRSMGVNPAAVDPSCECGEVLSAHRRGGRRGIDETDPPYRTLCVGFRKATRNERTLVRCPACGGTGGADGTCRDRDCDGTGMVSP